MKRFIQVILVALIFTFLWSCKNTEKIQVEEPKSTTSYTKFTYPNSTIAIPLELDLVNLSSRLNKELPKILYEDNNIEDDDLEIQVTKIGNLSLGSKNNLLSVALPLNAYIKGRYKDKPCSICPEISQSFSKNFKLKVIANSPITINNNWSLKTATKLSYEWIEKPSIDLGVTKIPINYILDPAIKKFINKANTMVDDIIAKELNLKSYIQEAWVSLQDPILLDSEFDNWLKTIPNAVTLKPLKVANNTISTVAVFNTQLINYTGKSTAKNTYKPLPNLQLSNNLNDETTLNLLSEISYDELNKIVAKYVNNTEYSFPENNAKVFVKEVLIKNAEDKLLIITDMIATQKKKKVAGKVYFLGVPYYEASDSSLRFKDVSLSIESKNVLAKSAGWLLKNGFFEKTIQKNLYYEFDEYIDYAFKTASQTLKESERAIDGIKLLGTVNTLNPQGIEILEDKLIAKIQAKAKLRVIVDGK